MARPQKILTVSLVGMQLLFNHRLVSMECVSTGKGKSPLKPTKPFSTGNYIWTPRVVGLLSAELVVVRNRLLEQKDTIYCS